MNRPNRVSIWQPVSDRSCLDRPRPACSPPGRKLSCLVEKGTDNAKLVGEKLHE